MSSAFRSPRTTWCSRRRISSLLRAIAARGCTGTITVRRVTVEGALNKESWFVFDFVELKRIMKRLCDEIDHLVLLPLKSDRVRGRRRRRIVSVSVDGKPRYVFPRKDCALLPIPNTTVEMLAQLLTERLHA